MPTPRPADRLLAALVMLATLTTVAVNALAALGLINGVKPSEISAAYPTVITPAGWAFSIWSLIYAGLLAFSIFQLLSSRLTNLSRIRVPYIVSCVLNCAWILLWHRFYIGWCGLVIALLLASLLWVNARFTPAGSFLEALLTKGVFGLYAGWVTVATLVNLVVYLVSAGVQFSATVWNMIAIGCLIAAFVAAVIMRVAYRNFVYPLAIAWAATAIGAQQSGNTAVVLAAAFACVASLILTGSVVTELRDSTSE